ncbi:SPFH domain/Band 7 family protein [Kineococcus xinjiangensis]|uniref:SPFH domain/Band 7 family protein n=1 Tax=Kineococcus xinjiangensis TaxID=512762 RepID=A0A2S6IPC2_9ACTN|nr:SPFH domain-containing protein [Kineococcus xinjiangensis]PPK96107.1 SPFH domain/Band 7 family protein [Kineococcus xinjiangensis]
MADITRYPFLRHLRGTPTAHVEHTRRGRRVHSGVAQSFWFRPLTAVLSEVPVDDRELPLLFHARTADFQDVTVQATVTFRIVQPDLAASRLDFSLDPATGRWRGAPLEQLATLLTETAQQHVLDALARRPLRDVLVTGVALAREQIGTGLGADTRLAQTGVAVLDVRVVAVRPTPEVEKALRTPTREQLQEEADRATYARRALAVERERAIGENELQNQIELARREEQLVAQRGANERRVAEEAAAASTVRTTAEAEREERLAAARATARRLTGEADAAAEAARIAAHADAAPELLLALAVRELAGNLPAIGSLVLTPDVLTGALARLGAAPERA